MQPVTIVGAGIAGLTLALTLARHGRPSMVLEAAERLDPIGAGIQLPPNAVRVLRILGLESSLNAVATAPREIVIRDAARERPLLRIPAGRNAERRHGAPSLVVHRGDLQSLLLDAARREPVIKLRFGEPFNAERCDPERWLVGADGVNSRVRELVRPNAAMASPTGTVAFRAMRSTRDLASPAWRNSTGLVLSPGRHLVHYPVCSGTMLNVVLLARGDADASTPPAAALQPFETYLGHLSIPPNDWTAWPIATVDERLPWLLGRTILIGDAAHAMAPHAAQGGAMALEDAITLGAAIGGSVPELAAWETARRKRVAHVAALSRRNRSIYWAMGLVRLGRNVVMRALPPSRLMRGMDALYGWEPPSIRSRP